MKKGILFGLVCLFILTGCGNGNKVVCKGKLDEAGMKADMTVTATIKSDKVDKVSASMTFDSKDTAKQYCSLFEMANSFAEDDEKVDFKCDGKTLTFENYSDFAGEDDEIIGMSKADFIKEMEKTDGVSCK